MRWFSLFIFSFTTLNSFADTNMEKAKNALEKGNSYLLCIDPGFLSNQTQDETIQIINSLIDRLSAIIEKPIEITAISTSGRLSNSCVAISTKQTIRD